MCELARKEKEFTSLAAISRTQNVSQGYLEQIVIPLRENRLVRGKRGFGGGYKLARPANTITVGEIIRVTEGPVAPVDCLHEDFSYCNCPDNCKAKPVWKKVGAAIEGVLNSITLGDLIQHTTKEGDPQHEQS